MRIPYGKRRYVPECCPKCGKTREVIASPPGSGLSNPSIYAVLSAYFLAWSPVLGEHPSEAWGRTISFPLWTKKPQP